MKKKICMILAAIMVVSLCPISALAEYGSSLFELMSTVASGNLSDSVTWRLDNDGTLYIEGAGSTTTQDPAAYESQYNLLDSHKNEITSIVIGDKITEISNLGSSGYDFHDMNNVTNIHIGSRVKTIVGFSGFTSLTELVIPDNVTTVNGFSHCTALRDISIPDSIEHIGGFYESAYYNDTNNWKDGVLYINNCLIDTKSEDIPSDYAIKDGTVCIAIGTFQNCGQLKEITFPESVKNIGWGAFENCTGVNKVYFNAVNCNRESDVKSLFPNIEKLIMGDKVTKIPGAMFYGCTKLKRVLFPKTLKEIGVFAFYDTGLKQVDIPENVTSIGDAAFAHCSELENIFVDSKNPRYYSDDGVLLNNYRYRLLTFPGAKEEYIIPDTVTQIDSLAFSGAVNLKEITLSGNITNFNNDDVFLDATGLETLNYDCEIFKGLDYKNCKNLSSINFGSNLTSIDGVFLGCNNLKELTIPENVIEISCSLDSGTYAFEGLERIYFNATDCYIAPISATIDEVYIGENVKKIPAFFLTNSDIEEFKIPDSVTEIGFGAFAGCNNLTEVTIPDSVKTIGQGDGGDWGLPSFGGTFSNCNNLIRVTIPSSVTEIGDDTFQNCSGDLTIVGYRNSYIEEFAYNKDIMFSAMDDKIEGNYTYLIEDGNAVIISVDNSISGNVRIPSTLGGYIVTEIGSYAFSGCKNMTSAEIPNSVTRIGINAFYNCVKLETIDIPDTVTYIGEYAFSGCHLLKNVTLPANLTKIASGLFNDCTVLESINIPDTVSYLGSKAFMNCKALNGIELPNSVTNISKYAFCSCKSLESISLGNNIREIGESAFAESGLTSIELPETVSKIHQQAFQWCLDLENVVIDNAPVTIGAMAFYDCPKLTDVSLGNAVKWIGNRAFNMGKGAALKSITIPKSVTSIGEDAFPAYDDFYINGYIGSCAERYSRINGYMFLKFDQVYENYFYLIEDGKAVITGTDGLLEGSVVLPDTIEGYSVTKIGEKAFMSRKSISDIKIPASITEIAFNAFSDCKGLVLQGNDFVYDYTLKNGLTYTEDLSQTQIEFSNVDSTLEADGDTVSGDVTMELDSNLNSFVDMSNIYLAIYIDGVLTDMVHSSILPEIGETKTVSFKDIGIDNPNHGECTMKVMIWDDMRFRPYAEVYEPQIGTGLQ